jgi:CRP-like cAMP-binding protein
MLFDIANQTLVHLAALVGVAALMFRDQIMLRGLLIASTVLYILYYVAIPAEPLWGAIFWSVVMIGVNALMMLRIAFDRTQFGLNADEERLFASFGTLTPGQFRTLMALATWRTADTRRILTREGAPVEQLYYVLDGAIGITKAGRSFPIGAGAFIGEIAFLRDQPATATVTLEPGTRYVEWPAQALARLLDRNAALKIALDTIFNADMAAKVARA